jgi:hypothetical protein
MPILKHAPRCGSQPHKAERDSYDFRVLDFVVWKELLRSSAFCETTILHLILPR